MINFLSLITINLINTLACSVPHGENELLAHPSTTGIVLIPYTNTNITDRLAHMNPYVSTHSHTYTHPQQRTQSSGDRRGLEYLYS